MDIIWVIIGLAYVLYRIGKDNKFKFIDDVLPIILKICTMLVYCLLVAGIGYLIDGFEGAQMAGMLFVGIPSVIIVIIGIICALM